MIALQWLVLENEVMLIVMALWACTFVYIWGAQRHILCFNLTGLHGSRELGLTNWF